MYNVVSTVCPMSSPLNVKASSIVVHGADLDRAEVTVPVRSVYRRSEGTVVNCLSAIGVCGPCTSGVTHFVQSPTKNFGYCELWIVKCCRVPKLRGAPRRGNVD